MQVGTPIDIIMNPADNYVEAFVKDVNRAKVLRAKTVMIQADKINTNNIKLSEAFKVNEYKDFWTNRSAVKRLGQPIDIAKGALFLASDLGEFVSGHGLVVDGGALVAGSW